MDKYLKALKPEMIKFMRKKYNETEVIKRWKKTKHLYSKWLREEGDLGGKENMMSSNMYLCYAMCAFYESVDRDFTRDDFKVLFNNVMKKSLALMNHIDMNKLENKKLLMRFAHWFMEKYKKKSDRKRGKEWGNTWKLRINPAGHKKGFAMSLDSCPLYEFAKKHGYMDLLPYMCETDHTIAKAFHAKLIRHNTLSSGDKTCDYWYVGDKSPEDLNDKGSK